MRSSFHSRLLLTTAISLLSLPGFAQTAKQPATELNLDALDSLPENHAGGNMVVTPGNTRLIWQKGPEGHPLPPEKEKPVKPKKPKIAKPKPPVASAVAPATQPQHIEDDGDGDSIAEPKKPTPPAPPVAKSVAPATQPQHIDDDGDGDSVAEPTAPKASATPPMAAPAPKVAPAAMPAPVAPPAPAIVPPQSAAPLITPPQPQAAPIMPATPPAAPAAPAAAPSGAATTSLAFKSTETTLPLTMKDQLTPIADKIKADPAMRVNLVAYAASSGEQASTARRVALSRALSVRANLIDMGVPALRINVQAEGAATSGEPDRVDIFTVQ